MTGVDLAGALPAAMALRLATMAATAVASRRPRIARLIAFLGSATASTLTTLAAGSVLHSGTPLHGVLFVQRASGFVVGYTIDALSAWFLLVLGVLAVPIAIFSIGYAAHRSLGPRSAFLGIGFSTLVGSIELIFAADDAVGFLFAWELMALVTAALIVTEHEVRETRRAAYLYLIMAHLGAGCLFAAFLVLGSHTGSLSFTSLLSGHVVSGPWRDVLFVLFFVGFGIKSGLVPLHVWLPEAHPAAPSTISALMSGVMLKTGIYGMVRFCAFGLGTPEPWWGILVVVCGCISSVLGVLYALMQHDIKRLLAYHSIENIGIILLGLGAAMMALAAGHRELALLGLAASLYHVLNHAIFKGLLFLGAGGVVMATGTRRIEEFGGLIKRMPWTALFFLVGALAISGLPPLNGFVSEWLTFQAFLYGFLASADPVVRSLFPVAAALLALTCALAAACFVKAFGISFLALPRSAAAADARESPAIMIVPQAFLAVLCLALGVLPGRVVQVLGGVVDSLPGMGVEPAMVRSALTIAPAAGTFDQVSPLVLALALLGGLGLAALPALRRRAAARTVPTWGCGGELTAGTEYTATAFSKPLMMIFGAIYRPTRQVEALAERSPYFPTEVRYHAEIEPTFERYVYGPVVRTVLATAERMKVLQAGSLHAYLAYVIALVLTLVLMVWWMG
jgi:hydrogenase-4 component B